jgi:protein involved in polysaccharide export with SLBB domain
MSATTHRKAASVWSLLTLCLVCTGCATAPIVHDGTLSELPRELRKVTQPPYVIEPPDELLLSATRLVPLPPYKIEPLDVLAIQVPEALPTDPISGLYPVEPEGSVNLGLTYGSIRVVGMTIEEARAAIERHLKAILKEPKASVSLAQSKALQQITGPHLVRPDGVINLGTYGQVYVTGMTIPEARAAIEAHLAQFLLKPELSVDVTGINSKVYYIITDQAEYGSGVVRLPITGNETVLDALAQIGGVPQVGSLKKIWIARPVPDDVHGEQILFVDYEAIAKHGQSKTNYQLLPGDRLYIHSDGYICFANWLDKRLAPVERALGFSLLVRGVVGAFSQGNQGGFFPGFGGFGF